MSNRIPPTLTDSPGHVIRLRSDGWVVTWLARTDILKRGYPYKSRIICVIGDEPSEIERDFISGQCKAMQRDMLVWSRGGVEAPGEYDGTIDGLIAAYKSDPQSTYKKLRHRSRRNYGYFLNRISLDHGMVRIADIKTREVIGWHEEWKKSGIVMAHSLMTMLRTILSFGGGLLEKDECLAVCLRLSKQKFEVGKPRTSRITYEQVVAICDEAHRLGYHSLALAQKLQFGVILRQRDVIGEWVPMSEPISSETFWNGKKWTRGIRGEEIDNDYILRHVTSKRQKEIEFDLKLDQMIMDHFKRFPPPKTGPIIVSESTGRPWDDNTFRETWRKIATAVGVPKSVRNMDSRAGGITEATEAGADLESIKHAATHSDIAMTQRYARGATEKVASVAQKRAEYRNKNRTST